ncbi:winged helix-turn-helix transcriptional regulator [Symbioplanes lichenis]|uniref:winged helix-turn-helix transcriptional regulator n=1 Tax=Symbioplanes lichenis TaxID=1629072 RepID=UPI00273826AF|nr:helix-turn-helix domain-containing protein [Actinoplanes lichenis]
MISKARASSPHIATVTGGEAASIGGVSDKALTESLHRLVATGLLERHAYAEAPPRVDYALSPLGRTFVEGPMRALATWVTRYGDELRTP